MKFQCVNTEHIRFFFQTVSFSVVVFLGKSYYYASTCLPNIVWFLLFDLKWQTRRDQAKSFYLSVVFFFFTYVIIATHRQFWMMQLFFSMGKNILIFSFVHCTIYYIQFFYLSSLYLYVLLNAIAEMHTRLALAVRFIFSWFLFLRIFQMFIFFFFYSSIVTMHIWRQFTMNLAHGADLCGCTKYIMSMSIIIACDLESSSGNIKINNVRHIYRWKGKKRIALETNCPWSISWVLQYVRVTVWLSQCQNAS